MLSAIVAIAKNNVIGNDNSLPWPHMPDDMKWFVKCTKNKPVIMGRSTFESLGNKPLPNRTNIVVSSSMNEPSEVDGFLVARTIDQAITIAENYTDVDNPETIIMGGVTIYQQTWTMLDRVYLTTIDQEYSGDTSLSFDHSEWHCVETNTVQCNGVDLHFQILER